MRTRYFPARNASWAVIRPILATTVALLVLAAPALGELRTLAEVHTPDRGEELTAFPVIDAYSVEAPSLRAGGVGWLFVNRGEPAYFGAFARRGQASSRTKAVAFAHDRGVAYFIDGGPGAEFEPNAQPGGAFALKADDAVAYRRMPRSWLPIPPPR